MSQFYENSIFNVDTGKITPNPYQPRREFNPARLRELADSINQYGILQPLVVTRKEEMKEDGGLETTYELIAGERRLRASKLIGLAQVPVIIRASEESDLEKLELAIIENLQREDLNPLDRARAFKRLVDEFGFKHITIAKKVGRSRVYVTNTLRILSIPEDMQQALLDGKINEGHTRPLLMLIDRPEEQVTLFKEIVFKKLTVREAELIARKIAHERARRKEFSHDPEIAEIEEKLAIALGTRVSIERKRVGGKITIDFFSGDDLYAILGIFDENKRKNPQDSLNNFIEKQNQENGENFLPTKQTLPEKIIPDDVSLAGQILEETPPEEKTDSDNFSPVERNEQDEEKQQDKDDDSDDLYSVGNFSI